MKHIEIAINHFGSQAALAKHINVAPQVVHNWLRRGNIPSDYCVEIEKASAGAVRCEILRPDIDWAYLRGSLPSNCRTGGRVPPEIPPDLQGQVAILKGLGKFADEDAIAWFLQLPPKHRPEVFVIHDCITSSLCIKELERIQVLRGEGKK